jgi:hypothetical protein
MFLSTQISTRQSAVYMDIARIKKQLEQYFFDINHPHNEAHCWNQVYAHPVFMQLHMISTSRKFCLTT